jgi:Domain of unknown function (DUF5666)
MLRRLNGLQGCRGHLLRSAERPRPLPKNRRLNGQNQQAALPWTVSFRGVGLMRVPGSALLACFATILFATILMICPGMAQDEGQEDPSAGIAQLFGQGDGIRGVVTAAQGGSFLVRTDDGDTYKIFYGPNTRMIKNREPLEARDVRMGDMLVAAGQLDKKAKTLGAVFLFDVDAAEVRKARQGFGKTWIAGKVTAIHDLTITIERAGDKQTQKIAVDENTSFRKKREDVTLAEVKVGDFISAQRALHNDLFTATILRVIEPRAGNPEFPPGPRSWSGENPSSGGPD